MHIDDDELEVYALRGPAWYNAAAIEEHLLICDLCRDRLDEIDLYIGLLRLALHLARPQ